MGKRFGELDWGFELEILNLRHKKLFKKTQSIEDFLCLAQNKTL